MKLVSKIYECSLITFNIISADECKNWNERGLLELITKLYELNKEYQFILLGGDESVHINIPNLINLSGITTIKEAAMLVSQSEIFIGVDSMLAHFTAIQNTQSIFLFSATSPYYCGPLNNNCVYITKAITYEQILKCCKYILQDKLKTTFFLANNINESLIKEQLIEMPSHAHLEWKLSMKKKTNYYSKN